MTFKKPFSELSYLAIFSSPPILPRLSRKIQIMQNKANFKTHPANANPLISEAYKNRTPTRTIKQTQFKPKQSHRTVYPTWYTAIQTRFKPNKQCTPLGTRSSQAALLRIFTRFLILTIPIAKPVTRCSQPHPIKTLGAVPCGTAPSLKRRSEGVYEIILISKLGAPGPKTPSFFHISSRPAGVNRNRPRHPAKHKITHLKKPPSKTKVNIENELKPLKNNLTRRCKNGPNYFSTGSPQIKRKTSHLKKQNCTDEQQHNHCHRNFRNIRTPGIHIQPKHFLVVHITFPNCKFVHNTFERWIVFIAQIACTNRRPGIINQMVFIKGDQMSILIKLQSSILVITFVTSFTVGVERNCQHLPSTRIPGYICRQIRRMPVKPDIAVVKISCSPASIPAKTTANVLTGYRKLIHVYPLVDCPGLKVQSLDKPGIKMLKSNITCYIQPLFWDFLLMAQYTSLRCTGIFRSAIIPSRTFPRLTSTTMISTSSPIIIDSFFLLPSTSIVIPFYIISNAISFILIRNRFLAGQTCYPDFRYELFTATHCLNSRLNPSLQYLRLPLLRPWCRHVRATLCQRLHVHPDIHTHRTGPTNRQAVRKLFPMDG